MGITGGKIGKDGNLSAAALRGPNGVRRSVVARPWRRGMTSTFAAAYRLEPGHRSGRRTALISSPTAARDRLAGLQRDVLIGSGIGEAWDQPEAGFTNSRSVTVDEGELPDRRIHRALVHDLLHL